MDSREQLRVRREQLLARSAELRAELMRDTDRVETKLHWIEPIADVIGQFFRVTDRELQRVFLARVKLRMRCSSRVRKKGFLQAWTDGAVPHPA